MSTPQMYNELYQHVQTWAGMLGAEDGDDIINHIYKRITAGIAEAIEERDRFKAALEESVALQSHYAMLLNMYDGGKRIEFSNAQEWIDRLASHPTGYSAP